MVASEPHRSALESVPAEQRALMVSHVVSIFRHIWSESFGPRMEDILRNALFALIEQPEHEPVSLASLPMLLQHREYRQRLLARVSNPVVRNFFELDYERWDKAFREQAISPVLNKVRAFLSDPAVLHIIGQKRSSFNIRWAMDTRKVLLVSLPKGTLGADVSKLIGSLLVTKISLACLSRQDTAKDLRVPHVLYIDEAHNYGLGVDYETILAEARKFALGLILASQTLSQFSESAVAAMFGNASTIASYRVSHDDAERMVRNFGVSGEGPKTAEQIFDTVVPPSELQRLPDFNFFVQTIRDGRPHDPELVQGFPPLSPEDMRRLWGDKGRVARKEHVIRKSLERYGRDRTNVQAEIHRMLAAA